MRVLRVEKSSNGFCVYPDGYEEFFFGENVFIALGRCALYFPRFFRIRLCLKRNTWEVKKRFGCWEISSRKGKSTRKVMELPLSPEDESVAPSEGFPETESVVSLNDLLHLLGAFLYVVRSQIEIDVRWKEKPEFLRGYGIVRGFETAKRARLQ